jgi:hypothetical protein
MQELSDRRITQAPSYSLSLASAGSTIWEPAFVGE